MAICDWGYESGDLEGPALHTVTLNLMRCNSMVVAALTCRLMEIWCADNCVDPWLIRQDRRQLYIGFSSDIDAVHFKLSGEWDTLEDTRRNF